MANQYYHIVPAGEELKRICPTLSFDNYHFVQMTNGEEVQFNNSQVILAPQDQQIVINNDQVQHVIYQQQNSEEMQTENSFVTQTGQVLFVIFKNKTIVYRIIINLPARF